MRYAHRRKPPLTGHVSLRTRQSTILQCDASRVEVLKLLAYGNYSDFKGAFSAVSSFYATKHADNEAGPPQPLCKQMQYCRRSLSRAGNPSRFGGALDGAVLAKLKQLSLVTLTSQKKVRTVTSSIVRPLVPPYASGDIFWLHFRTCACHRLLRAIAQTSIGCIAASCLQVLRYDELQSSLDLANAAEVEQLIISAIYGGLIKVRSLNCCIDARVHDYPSPVCSFISHV